ncbi:MAG TPA: acetyl ornithine aminotransferase family protein [Gemmatimonadota bacterium]|nr:acetyl ornithine aminotransferase family protein [Gemmatimonadota bacterium]
MAQMTDTTTKTGAAKAGEGTAKGTGKAGDTAAPELHGALPGAKAQDWIRRDGVAISPSYTRSYGAVIERGLGCTVWDVDGNAFIDVSAGIAVTATGHCHPKVVAAIQDQAAKLIHMSGTDFYYPSQIQLAEKLTSLFPGGGPAKAFFGNSGAEAIEAGMKLARYHTGRMRFLAFRGSFHGRTMGALSLTASKAVQRKGFGPLIAGVHHLAFPDPYRGGTTETSLAELEHVLETIAPPEEVAAIVVEPVQGEGGYVLPPDGWFEAIEAVCRKHGILLFVDEVQSGMGRTGKMWAIEHTKARPDMVAVAKGVASGMPLGVLLAKSDIMDWTPGAHASTFGGNPIACRAALATIELLESELIANANEVGGYIKGRLEAMADDHDAIGDVRGRGLMIGVELVEDRKTKKRAKKLRDEIVNRCFEKGLLILGCGPNAIRWAPALVIDRETADKALEIFEEVLTELEP